MCRRTVLRCRSKAALGCLEEVEEFIDCEIRRKAGPQVRACPGMEVRLILFRCPACENLEELEKSETPPPVPPKDRPRILPQTATDAEQAEKESVGHMRSISQRVKAIFRKDRESKDES